MTETSPPTAVFYGSSSPEKATPPKKESKIITEVKKAVDSWLDRIGTKDMEERFVKAHQNVLNTLTDEKRKDAFAKTENSWRRTGKIIGVTTTVIDAALAGYGTYLTVEGWKRPQQIMEHANTVIDTLTGPYAGPKTRRFGNGLAWMYELLYGHPPPGVLIRRGNRIGIGYTRRDDIVNKSFASIPGLAALQTAAGYGPAKILGRMAASGIESVGKIQAHSQNYVDSGKAAEHAKAVGSAIGKAATETAKYAAEHPDEIRKTVETVSRVSQETREHNQKIKVAQQKAADAKLDAEYNDWVNHHPDKAYYQNSGQPMPSKAEYVEMKRREAAAKKANDDLQKRNSHFEL